MENYADLIEKLTKEKSSFVFTKKRTVRHVLMRNSKEQEQKN